MYNVNVEQVKGKLKENWKPILIGTGFVVLIGATAILTRRVYLLKMTNKELAKLVNYGAAVNAPYSVIRDNIFVVQSPRQGPPGWMVYCPELDKLWPTQTAFANEIGVSESTVSRYFNGRGEHLVGLHPQRIGMSAA